MSGLADALRTEAPLLGLRVLTVGSLFLGLCLVVVPAIWRRSASGRHVTYLMALALFAGVPALGVVAPRIDVPVVFGLGASTLTGMPGVASSAVVGGDGADGPASPSVLPASGPAPRLDGNTGATPAFVVLFLWGVPAAALAVFVLVGVGSATRVARRGRPVHSELEEITPLPPCVRVVESRHAGTAFTWGLWRHTIVLPPGWRVWAPADLRAVLTHELAHARRRDPVGNLVSSLVCAIYWFQPLVWWVARRARHEAELACDDAVVSSGAPPREYAALLLRLALPSGGGAPLSPVASLGASSLERRLRALVRQTRPDEPWRRWKIFGSAGLLMLGATAAAGVRAAPPADSARVESPSAAATAADLVSEVIAIGDRRARREVPRLVDLVRTSTDPEVRRAALRALGEIRDRSAATAVGEALSDPSPDVRLAAIGSLEELLDASTAASLEGALADPEPAIRSRAAALLGEIGLSEAPTALIGALSDANTGVRRNAARALGEIGDDGALAGLARSFADPDAGVAREALRAAKELDSRAAYRLVVAASETGPPETQEFAAALVRTW